MPEIMCRGCGQRCRVAAQDPSVRCVRCGTRNVVQIELPDAPVGHAPIVHPEPTLLVDAPLAAAGEDGETAARAHVSCPWCGAFVAPVSVCEACGAGIPAVQPVPFERDVQAPAPSARQADGHRAR